MKIKVNKAGFIVSLVFTAIFAIGAVVFLIMDLNSPADEYFIFLLMMLMFTVIFLIAALASYFTVRRQQKRYDMICANLAQMDCHAQLLIGAYGEKGAAGKAAAKTAASAIGGIFMALFFGFGAYKIYGANNQAEFVLTDGGLFVGRPARSGFDLNNMTFIENGKIPATVTVKKNCVIMKNDFTGEYFNFNTKNSGVGAQQLAERLNNFLHPARAATVVAASDPFADDSAAAGQQTPNTGDAAKQLPFDDPFAD